MAETASVVDRQLSVASERRRRMELVHRTADMFTWHRTLR